MNQVSDVLLNFIEKPLGYGAFLFGMVNEGKLYSSIND